MSAQQLPLFAQPPDPGLPPLSPELDAVAVAALRAVGVRCVAVRWSSYWGYWQYDLQRIWGRWTPAAPAETVITKALEGVYGVLRGLEKEQKYWERREYRK